jgi:uncharacterized protein
MSDQPLCVTFHLTHHCNLRCDYCYTGEKLPISMTDQTLLQAVQFVQDEVVRRETKQLDITFFGGEPLLEKTKIFQIIDLLDQMGKQVSIHYKLSTNGTLLTDELVRRLLTKKVYMSLSLDGGPSVTDHQRKNAAGKGVTHQIVKGLQLLLKYNKATNVTCVITPESADRVAESIDYIFEQGVRFITTTLDYSADWEVSHFDQLKRSYQKLGRWYEEKMKAGDRFYLSFFDERIQTRTHKPIAKSERCHIGQRQFSIAPNGELYPCIQFVTTEGIPEYLIGHIKTGFDESCTSYITNCSEKPKAECTGCALESRCSKWCSCVNYMSTGRIDQASPIVCYNERILMGIVDKTADRLWKSRNNLFVHKHYNSDYPVISHIELNL